MDNRSSAENQLSIALECLSLISDAKQATTKELRANNRELEAILDELLGLRRDLKPAVEEINGAAGAAASKPVNRNIDFKDLNLDQIQREVDGLLQKGQTATEESMALRLRSKKLRAALADGRHGHAKHSVNGTAGVDGSSKHATDGAAGLDEAAKPATDGPAPANGGYNHLSKRERQVLALIVAGKSSKQIAAELGISFKTAVTHRASIMGKMNVHEIASVVREAIRRGLA